MKKSASHGSIKPTMEYYCPPHKRRTNFPQIQSQQSTSKSQKPFVNSAVQKSSVNARLAKTVHSRRNENSSEIIPDNNRKNTVNLQRSPIKLKVRQKQEDHLRRFVLLNEINFNFAINYPNQFHSEALVDLVGIIMERVVKGVINYETGVKFCITVIQKQKEQTFLEFLIKTCEQWYENRDEILSGITIFGGNRFVTFTKFVKELYEQFKQMQMQEKYQSVLLLIVAKCCQVCVSEPIKCLLIECLVSVLSQIGKDLENVFPVMAEELFENVRDAFIESAGNPVVCRKLLQLIELRASSWQLSEFSAIYYNK